MVTNEILVNIIFGKVMEVKGKFLATVSFFVHPHWAAFSLEGRFSRSNFFAFSPARKICMCKIYLKYITYILHI